MFQIAKQFMDSFKKSVDRHLRYLSNVVRLTLFDCTIFKKIYLQIFISIVIMFNYVLDEIFYPRDVLRVVIPLLTPGWEKSGAVFVTFVVATFHATPSPFSSCKDEYLLLFLREEELFNEKHTRLFFFHMK